ncbi:MAG TPA: ATP-binding protein [Burkholderiales bacterium]|nr:ATP-binding protein [Burkholderiales bacterium]
MAIPSTVTIQRRLGLLVAASVLPAALAGVLLVGYSYHQQRANIEQGTIATARALVQNVDRELASAEAALQALATSPQLARGSLSAFYDQAVDSVRGRPGSNIVLSDSSGRQLINTLRPFGEPLPMHGNPDQLRRVFDTRKPVVSDLYIGGVTRRPLVGVDIPVIRDGQVVFDLSMGFEPERLGLILTRQRLPAEWVASIFDSQGTYVARTHDAAANFVGQKGAPELMRRIAEVAEGRVETELRDGTPVLAVFSRSEVSNWTVAIRIPRALLARQLWLPLSAVIAGLALLLATGLLFAKILSADIARSIRALIEPATALGLGDPVRPPAPGLREADEVGRAIVRAADLLRQRTLERDRATGALADRLAELSRSNEALARSEARLRGILESALDAIVTIDHARNIVTFNPAAEAIFGWSGERALGVPIGRLIPELGRTEYDFIVDEVSAKPLSAMAASRVLIGVRANGERFPIEASIAAVGVNGERTYTLIMRDVTERVRAQQALEQRNADLQQFAYVASHDLKTPLRSIAGFVELLQSHHAAGLDARAADWIRRAAAAARRLDAMTDDLLAFARLDARSVRFEPVDCRQAYEEALGALATEIDATHADVARGELPVVVADRLQLVQLLEKLIGNAIKYCGDRKPQVRVSAERGSWGWRFAVSDNGIGIEPRHRQRIFDVFRRLHNQQELPGSGIGLAICRRVVDRHGGTIWVESQPGKGSTFFFTIPDLKAA